MQQKCLSNRIVFPQTTVRKQWRRMLFQHPISDTIICMPFTDASSMQCAGAGLDDLSQSLQKLYTKLIMF